MPKLVPEMSDAAVRRLKHGTVKGGNRANQKQPPGSPCAAYHAVGGVPGLLLQCRPPTPGNAVGARSWVLRTTVGGKRRDIGLGGYPEVTLSEARQRARAAKAEIRDGKDPVMERRAKRSALIASQHKEVTFKEIAAKFIRKKSKEFKTAKQTQKLTKHLEMYAYPYIGNMVVSDIERAHIVKMLEPIWHSKTETASRTRASVERILDLAGAEGLRSGDNPARWKGNLELSLPLPSKVAKVQHYKALPVTDLPGFMAELEKLETIGAKALRFGILTAARSGEIRGATWDEIDLDTTVWTIPGERMKGGRTHKVPLCKSAVKLLKSLPRLSEVVFPGIKGQPLSDATLGKVARTMGYKVTQHGFRATFRTWAQEYTNYPEEVPELALAHVNSDRTRAAYARSELLDKRRKLMNDWQEFCRHGAPEAADKVVNIGGSKNAS